MLYNSKRKLKKKIDKRLAARYDIHGRPTTEELVFRLLRVDPTWSVVLHSCLIVSSQDKGQDKFAGAWVMQNLRALGETPPNNLRTLTGIGLLKLVTTSRSGNRAYYTIPDKKGIARGLKNLPQ